MLERAPATQGWDTTDKHEVELRRWRGRTEITTVEALETGHPVFGAFRVRSDSGSAYDVEIRGLDTFSNSCGCVDHRVNGLGTCKHIEGVLAGLRLRGGRALGAAAETGPSRVEVFLRRQGAPTPEISWSGRAAADLSAVRTWLAPYLDTGRERRICSWFSTWSRRRWRPSRRGWARVSAASRQRSSTVRRGRRFSASSPPESSVSPSSRAAYSTTPAPRRSRLFTPRRRLALPRHKPRDAHISTARCCERRTALEPPPGLRPYSPQRRERGFVGAACTFFLFPPGGSTGEAGVGGSSGVSPVRRNDI